MSEHDVDRPPLTEDEAGRAYADIFNGPIDPDVEPQKFANYITLEKYRRMRSLVAKIAVKRIGDPFPPEEAQSWSKEAADILAGLTMPRGPWYQADERAQRLERLARAYRILAQVSRGYDAGSPSLEIVRDIIRLVRDNESAITDPQPIGVEDVSTDEFIRRAKKLST